MLILNPYRFAAAAGGFTPADLTETIAWYDTEDDDLWWQDPSKTTPAGDGDTVGAFDDKVGTNHGEQLTSGKRGQRNLTGGLWSVDFDGVDDEYALSMSEATEDFTFCVGLNITGGDPAKYIFDAETGRLIIAPDNNQGVSNDDIAFYDGAWKSSGTSYANGAQVLTFQLIAGIGNASIRRNGAVIGSGLTYVQNAIGGSVSLFGHHGITTTYLGGKLHQFVLTSPPVTGTDLSNLESFVADKSGVTL